jgi:hypothetical protein
VLGGVAATPLFWRRGKEHKWGQCRRSVHVVNVEFREHKDQTVEVRRENGKK